MKVMYRLEIFQEGDLYVGVCPELNVSSFGDDPEDTGRSLHEAVEAFLETCHDLGTVEDVLEESDFCREEGIWVSSREQVG